MILKDLLHNFNYISCNDNTSVEVCHITNNTKEVAEGSVYVCIEGFKTDGHNFIDEAVKKGASAVLVTKDIKRDDVAVVRVADTRASMAELASLIYGQPSKKLKMIGVTGTNGKTTVTHIIKTVLEMNGKKAGLIGTNTTVIGDKVIEAERTTPESGTLHKWFAEMVDAGVEYCVMEVSSHSIELQRVAGIHFDAAVFTNLTHDHLDFHGTMENYMESKAKLFDRCDVAVINADDEYGRKIAEKCKAKVFTYSIDENSDFKAKDIEYHDKGVIYNVAVRGEEHKVKAMHPGKFSVYNSLATYALCSVLGFESEEIEKGIIIAKGAKGRAEIVNVPAPFKVMIDYAHTPDGLYNILTTMRGTVSGRIITVFGAPGDRDKTKRPEMGEVAGNLSDYAIITSDNPASEKAEDIAVAVEEGMKKTGCKYECITDRAQAIERALSIAKQGDLVLLAGKGHETYQIIGNEKVPFCEEKIVKNYFM